MGRSSSLRLPNITVCFRTCHWNEPHLDIPRYGKKGLLFNSLSKLQTKPLSRIRHICDFSRCVLNVRLCARIQHLLRDHKYALFGTMASVLWLEEGELNMERGFGGTEVDVFCLLENDWEQRDDLAFLMIISVNISIISE